MYLKTLVSLGLRLRQRMGVIDLLYPLDKIGVSHLKAKGLDILPLILCVENATKIEPN